METMADLAAQAMHDNLWLLFVCLAAGPFVQEDAALFAAAGVAASGMAPPAAVFAVFLAALCLSDVWKYGLGRAAHRVAWARRIAETPAARHAAEALRARLGRTLVTVRFIPGARVATYVAAGYARAPFVPFAIWIVISAALLTGLVFAAFMLLGMAAGDRLRAWLPLIAVAAAGVGIAAALVRSRFAPR